MPLFVAIFADDQEAAPRVRAIAEEAHVAWLENHRDQVLMAGALRPADGGEPTGGSPPPREPPGTVPAEAGTEPGRRWRAFAHGSPSGAGADDEP